MHTKTLLMIAAMVALVSTSSLAAAQPPGGGPPPEAIAACEGQSEGDACSFTGRRGEALEGICGGPQGRPLACVPEGHEEGRGQ